MRAAHCTNPLGGSSGGGSRWAPEAARAAAVARVSGRARRDVLAARGLRCRQRRLHHKERARARALSHAPAARTNRPRASDSQRRPRGSCAAPRASARRSARRAPRRPARAVRAPARRGPDARPLGARRWLTGTRAARSTAEQGSASAAQSRAATSVEDQPARRQKRRQPSRRSSLRRRERLPALQRRAQWRAWSALQDLDRESARVRCLPERTLGEDANGVALARELRARAIIMVHARPRARAPLAAPPPGKPQRCAATAA